MTRWSLAAIGFSISVAGLATWLYTPDKSPEELAAKYLRQPTDFVNVRGVKIHTRDDGPRDAPAILFLHGFGASLHTWEPWAASLSPKFRVIRIDLPGFGLTGADPLNDYSDERTIGLLSDLLNQLGISKATIVGNSIGGRIAWKFAAAKPNLTEKLVLISPDGFASPGFQYGKPPEVPAAMALMSYAMPTFMVRMSMAPAYANPNFMSDELVARYRDLMLAPGVRDAMLRRMSQSVLIAPEPVLRKIIAPTLVMWGEKDAMIPFANAADYMRLLPNAQLASFQQLGHLPHEEGPTETVGVLREFLLRK
jgi:pimeloyl-ACP methyl ester carboxylesterase